MKRLLQFCIVIGVISLILGAVSFAIGRSWNRSRGYVDIQPALPQSLAVPLGEYKEVVWLGENLLAFRYLPPAVSPSLWNYQLIMYDLDIEDSQEVLLAKPSKCISVWSVNINRLPNNNLGFLYQCNVSHGSYSLEQDTLYMWDKQINSFQVLQAYPEGFAAASYTFAPDMSSLIQEEAVGSGLNNKLYRVGQDGRMDQLFSDFQRVRAPAWSSDGSLIAFFGTQTYPERKSNDLGYILGLFSYPWDLYLMDANDQNVHIILSGLAEVHASEVKWVPQSSLLSFSGKYKNLDGIWIVDVHTLQLARIWPTRGGYDFSPDGQQMAIIPWASHGELAPLRPVVIDLPPKVFGTGK